MTYVKAKRHVYDLNDERVFTEDVLYRVIEQAATFIICKDDFHERRKIPTKQLEYFEIIE